MCWKRLPKITKLAILETQTTGFSFYNFSSCNTTTGCVPMALFLLIKKDLREYRNVSLSFCVFICAFHLESSLFFDEFPLFISFLNILFFLLNRIFLYIHRCSQPKYTDFLLYLQYIQSSSVISIFIILESILSFHTDIGFPHILLSWGNQLETSCFKVNSSLLMICPIIEFDFFKHSII